MSYTQSARRRSRTPPHGHREVAQLLSRTAPPEEAVEEAERGGWLAESNSSGGRSGPRAEHRGCRGGGQKEADVRAQGAVQPDADGARAAQARRAARVKMQRRG